MNLSNSPHAFVAGQQSNRKTHPFYSFLYQNELVWDCCLLTWRITLVVDESHSSDTQLIFSLPHSCQNKQKPDLAFLKVCQIFSCNREFCWECGRKSKHLYFFDELGRTKFTSDICSLAQLSCFSTSALHLSEFLQQGSPHGLLSSYTVLPTVWHVFSLQFSMY